MSAVDDPLLLLLVGLPLLASALVLLFPRQEPSGVRGAALLASAGTLALALTAYARFDAQMAGLQLEVHLPWIPSVGAELALGLDALSLPLVLLTALLTPVAICASSTPLTGSHGRGLMACLLLLEGGILGALLASDLLLFYVFWELSLVPAYVLVGLWPTADAEPRAALRFFIYTLGGSLCMLLALICTAWLVRDGALSFSWAVVASRLAERDLGAQELWLLGAYVLAFGIKLPLFPLHGWLRATYSAASPAALALIAGMLGKLGAYGMLRYALWLFPRAAQTALPLLAVLAVVGLVYGAALACVQRDLRGVLAFSSLSHLGLVMLGILSMTVTGMGGSLMLMLSHGLTTAALFLLVGMLHLRRGSLALSEMGGLARQMPLATCAFMGFGLAAVGLPGLSGFVGEFLVLLGSYTAGQTLGLNLFAPLAVVAAASSVPAALYLLRAVQPVFFGPPSPERHSDLTGREQLTLLPLAAGVLLLGLWPQPLLSQLEPGAAAYVTQFRARAGLFALPAAQLAAPARGARPGLPPLPGGSPSGRTGGAW